MILLARLYREAPVKYAAPETKFRPDFAKIFGWAALFVLNALAWTAIIRAAVAALGGR